MYVAESSPGLYTVKAETNGLEGIAEIRIAIPSQPGGAGGEGGGDSPSTKKAIRWQGEVPQQKWMNFYTKVLSRFASTEGLKIKVSFEVPADGEQSRAKADEAKSGLKELGLDDNVQLG